MNLKYLVVVLLLLCSLAAHLSAAELRLYTEDYRPFSYLENSAVSAWWRTW